MSVTPQRSRLSHALAGGLLALSLVVIEATLRWPAALSGTTIPAEPLLPQVALLLGLPLGLVLGLAHRWLPVLAALSLALALGEPRWAAAGAVLLAAALVELAWRWPAISLLPVLGLGAGAILLRPQVAPRTASSPPDIVLVVLDTVSAPATSLHGSALPTTPSLEALAAQGTVYEHALAAAPWTVPSHAALFTGLLPQELGCHHEHPQLDVGPPTTAEALAAAGYRTGAFVANPWVGDFNGLTRGFQHREANWQRARAVRAFTLLSLVPPRASKGGAGLVAAALSWLDRGGEQPSFLFLNLLEAHSPFAEAPDAARFGVDQPERISERTHRVQEGGLQAVPDYPLPGELDAARTLYGGAIAAADGLLGELRAGLEERGRWERAVVAATSDHGEAFGEHGFHGHMIGLYRETLHVPLVLRVPGREPARVQGPVALRRLHPTLLQLAGLEPGGAPLPTSETAPELPVVSEQLRPLQVISDFERDGAASELGELDARAVRVALGPLALVLEEPLSGGRRFRLYDHRSDPREERDLWGQRAELDPQDQGRLARMQALAEQRAESFRLASARQATAIEGDIRAQLEALGYLGGE